MNHVLDPLGVHKRAASGDISPLVVNHFNVVFCALAQSDEEYTRRGGDGRETVQRGRGPKRQGAENRRRGASRCRLVYLLVACKY